MCQRFAGCLFRFDNMNLQATVLRHSGQYKTCIGQRLTAKACNYKIQTVVGHRRSPPLKRFGIAAERLVYQSQL
jgi:hypothetical protein